jgi:hypothetical protein
MPQQQPSTQPQQTQQTTRNKVINELLKLMPATYTVIIDKESRTGDQSVRDIRELARLLNQLTDQELKDIYINTKNNYRFISKLKMSGTSVAIMYNFHADKSEPEPESNYDIGQVNLNNNPRFILDCSKISNGHASINFGLKTNIKFDSYKGKLALDIRGLDLHCQNSETIQEFCRRIYDDIELTCDEQTHKCTCRYIPNVRIMYNYDNLNKMIHMYNGNEYINKKTGKPNSWWQIYIMGMRICCIIGRVCLANKGECEIPYDLYAAVKSVFELFYIQYALDNELGIGIAYDWKEVLTEDEGSLKVNNMKIIRDLTYKAATATNSKDFMDIIHKLGIISSYSVQWVYRTVRPEYRTWEPLYTHIYSNHWELGEEYKKIIKDIKGETLTMSRREAMRITWESQYKDYITKVTK